MINGTYSFNVTVENVPHDINNGGSSKGCGGSIATTSIVLTTLTLFGIGLIVLKKKGGSQHDQKSHN